MLASEVVDAVTRLITTVVDAEALPRWRRPAELGVTEKGPGDFVTLADRHIEQRLGAGLTALLPGSVVVGEEAVHEDPSVLTAFTRTDPVWVIDPIDGTAGFIAGTEDFATLVALLVDGVTVAAWTYAPALNLLARAVIGEVTTINGAPVRISGRGDGAARRVIVGDPSYWTDEDRQQADTLIARGIDVRPCTASGVAYLDLVRGGADGAVFGWEKPWDHLAGLFLLAMAGGHSATMAGQAFRPNGGNLLPLLIGADSAVVASLRTWLSD